MRAGPARLRRRAGVGARLAAVVAAGLGAAACGTSAAAPARAAILTASRATHTVHLDLVAAATGADSGFNFDGYGNGQMTVSVPLGWSVVVTCTNHSATFTHSCAIVRNGRPQLSGAPLAFPGAQSAAAHTGLARGVSSTFRFSADRAGRYRIACLVTAHEVDGMWDWFVVTTADNPGVSLRRS